MAQFSKHGNGNGLDDLYILPDTAEERRSIQDYLTNHRHTFGSFVSNVDGQDWYGQVAIEIPCGEYLQPEIEGLLRGDK